jgi:hypothetical protein
MPRDTTNMASLPEAGMKHSPPSCDSFHYHKMLTSYEICKISGSRGDDGDDINGSEKHTASIFRAE